MENRDLLFMLKKEDDGETQIYLKGVYNAAENKIKFLNVEETELFDNIYDATEGTYSLHEEDQDQYNYLKELISKDNTLLERIENSNSMKLLFLYE